nr:GNAT family N-acetyltransferase [Devosia oryzisoli]
MTERLLLRPPNHSDFDEYAALLISPRAMYMGGPLDRRVSWGMFCSDIAMWHLYGHGALMIELRESGRCIGQVGINHGPFYSEKELGWLLYEGQEGRGCATEAAACLRDWAFAELELGTLVSYIDPLNAASIRVAERLGGIHDENAVPQDPGDVVYRYNPA